MMGLSMTEVIIILALALLLLGPDQLPTIAKSLGKGLREIRKATDDLKSTFEQEMVRLDEVTNPAPDPQKPQLQPVAPAPEQTAAAPAGEAASVPPPELPPDPAAARAAARRKAVGGAPALRLVPPEGVVAAPPAAEPPAQPVPPDPAVKDVP